MGMPISNKPLLIYSYDTGRDNMLRVFESKFTNMQLVLTVLDTKHKYYSKYIDTIIIDTIYYIERNLKRFLKEIYQM